MHSLILLTFFVSAYGIVEPSMTSAIVSGAGQGWAACGSQQVTVCEFTFSTGDVPISALGLNLTVNNGLLLMYPGLNGFSPSDLSVCGTYMTAGSTVIQQDFSLLTIRNNNNMYGQGFFYQQLSTGVTLPVMRVAYTGASSTLTGGFFAYAPSQVAFELTVSCGTGGVGDRPACAQPKSADQNGDGKVTIVDIVLVLDSWGSCGSKACIAADLDCNNSVDVYDLVLLLRSWSPKSKK